MRIVELNKTERRESADEQREAWYCLATRCDSQIRKQCGTPDREAERRILRGFSRGAPTASKNGREAESRDGAGALTLGAILGAAEAAAKEAFEVRRAARSQQGIDLPLQSWKVVSDRPPDDFQIQEEVLMDRYVAHPAHLRPGNLGMQLDKVRCGEVDFAHGLADDLDVANNSVLNLGFF